MRDIAIVLTTINIPIVLDSHCDNISDYGYKNETTFVVVGDYKTPSGVKDYIAALTAKRFNVIYLDVEYQKAWLKIGNIVSWNSDARRCIGYLFAVSHLGAKVIISIDDDNYALPQYNFVGGHSIVNTVQNLGLATSDNRWVNVCEFLMETPRPIYVRGFPYGKRWHDTYAFCKNDKSSTVLINEGLWRGSPDVDAVTNLDTPTKITTASNGKIALAKDNYSPINTQNTAFSASLLPCLYYIPMGFRYEGNVVDRYGDIWLGFLAQKVIHKVGGLVTFGTPVVDHIRNKHDYLKDLRFELGGMILTEKFAQFLEEIELRSTSYSEAYVELGQKLRDRMIDSDVGTEAKSYFAKLAENMETWVETCERETK